MGPGQMGPKQNPMRETYETCLICNGPTGASNRLCSSACERRARAGSRGQMGPKSMKSRQELEDEILSSCLLGKCPLYQGDCLNAGRCMAKDYGLLDTGWNQKKYLAPRQDGTRKKKPMRRICINREGAPERWAGTRVRWILCKACKKGPRKRRMRQVRPPRGCQRHR